VLVPRAGGVLSALGLAMSDVRRDYVRPLLGGEDAEDAFEAMEEQAGEDMDEPELRRRADLRYRGQSFELTVPLGGDVAEAFHRAHEERYGYADRSRPLELVALRTATVGPGPEYVQAHGAAGPTATGLVELNGSTAWIPPGWRGDWRDGSLVVIRA
jgi:N-methylhydantoinase A